MPTVSDVFADRVWVRLDDHYPACVISRTSDAAALIFSTNNRLTFCGHQSEIGTSKGMDTFLPIYLTPWPRGIPHEAAMEKFACWRPPTTGRSPVQLILSWAGSPTQLCATLFQASH